MADENEVKALADRMLRVQPKGYEPVSATIARCAEEALRWRDETRPQQPAAAVPAGYALVPVEPTEAMLDAGHAAAWRRIPSCFDMTDAEIVYRAMLAAAERKGDS